MAVQLQERPLARLAPQLPAETPDHLDDRPCPLFFLIAPAFVGALIWLWAILSCLRP